MTRNKQKIERETQDMYADYLTGMSCAAIGRKYHYDAQTIWSRFKARGLQTRPVSQNNQRERQV